MEALSQGYLFGMEWGPVEELIPGGVRTNYGLTRLDGTLEIGPREETFSGRENRIRALISDLARLSAILASGPFPVDWFGAGQASGNAPATSGSACVPIDLDNLRNNSASAWLNPDAYIVYACYANRIGRSDADVFMNGIFVQNHSIRTTVAPRRPVSSATDTGIYLIVRDPKNAPMRYERLTGKEGWGPRGAVIVTVWHDDAGYFYYRDGERFYLPERP